MKILVVDDHFLIREALSVVIREQNRAANVLEASDWRHAASQIEANRDLELILLDLKLPDRDGFEILAELRQSYPAVSVVVLSAHQDRATVRKALEFGAVGFIPKSASRLVMLGALNLIFSGGMYVPPEILGENEPMPAQAPTKAQPFPEPSSSIDLGLTERQMQVLSLMMQGRSNKAICRTLDLAEPTVKNHVTAILRAFKAANRTQAVIAASARGLGLPRSSK